MAIDSERITEMMLRPAVTGTRSQIFSRTGRRSIWMTKQPPSGCEWVLRRQDNPLIGQLHQELGHIQVQLVLNLLQRKKESSHDNISI